MECGIKGTHPPLHVRTPKIKSLELCAAATNNPAPSSGHTRKPDTWTNTLQPHASKQANLGTPTQTANEPVHKHQTVHRTGQPSSRQPCSN